MNPSFSIAVEKVPEAGLRPNVESIASRDLRILVTQPHALAPELLRMTELLPEAMRSVGDSRRRTWVRRLRQLRRTWTLFRLAPTFDVVITMCSLDGLAF